MKKFFPYIFLSAAFFLMALLLISSLGKNKHRVLDERITLKVKDKIPYGVYVAYHLLQHSFPSAQILYDKKSPGNWDSISTSNSGQAVIMMSKEFDADEYELKRLLSFVQHGNYVYIITRDLSYDAAKFFGCTLGNTFFYAADVEDSLTVSLAAPHFTVTKQFIYPGKKYESYFEKIDTAATRILGRGGNNRVNFIQLKAGKGAVFIHIAPLAFSNYFLLHKNNINYFKNALSIIPPDCTKILWNDYYLTKPQFRKEENKSWFRVLMKYPALRGGLLTAIATLLLLVFLEMRRRQRMIPRLSKPKNDTLDFVKTIGRLYYDKSDHKNLAKKMSAYFLEHVRSRYKLPTHSLDQSFIAAVHAKSGYDSKEIGHITDFILFLDTTPAISEKQLAHFHKQLELFYQNT